MDRDKDAKLTYEEFVEGSKQDPTIVQVRFPFHHTVPLTEYTIRGRLYRCTTDSYSIISRIRMSALGFYLSLSVSVCASTPVTVLPLI